MLRIEALSGEKLRPLVPQLARLRIEVFRDWPYLYDGSYEYEEGYLGRFLSAPDHVAVCAFDGDRVVGASTASPLIHQYEEFSDPFRRAGYPIADIFYFGESVLEPAYRGRGIGNAFFDGRETHADSLGYGRTAFCAVIRPPEHPLRPSGYRALDDFWTKRGYRPLSGIMADFSWKDIDEAHETSKPMQFWGRGF
jgi:GNAT superfamily N-acetyltransferase